MLEFALGRVVGRSWHSDGTNGVQLAMYGIECINERRLVFVVLKERQW